MSAFRESFEELETFVRNGAVFRGERERARVSTSRQLVTAGVIPVVVGVVVVVVVVVVVSIVLITVVVSSIPVFIEAEDFVVNVPDAWIIGRSLGDRLFKIGLKLSSLTTARIEMQRHAEFCGRVP